MSVLAAGSVIRQSLPLIALCGAGEALAGLLLAGKVDTLEALPGLIVLLPALLGLRGNTGTSLGARLGTAAHLGLISEDDLWNDELRANLRATFFLTVYLSFLAGVLGYVSSYLLGIPTLPPIHLIGIAVMTGILAGSIAIVLTIGVIIIAFRKGLDPDNVVGPCLSTLGDIVTIGCLFFVAYIYMSTGGAPL